MTTKSQAARIMGRAGGKARALKLSAAERSRIASIRWIGHVKKVKPVRLSRSGAAKLAWARRKANAASANVAAPAIPPGQDQAVDPDSTAPA